MTGDYQIAVKNFSRQIGDDSHQDPSVRRLRQAFLEPEGSTRARSSTVLNAVSPAAGVCPPRSRGKARSVRISA